MKAGHCAKCDTPIWKIITHPTTEQPIPLWPRPDSLYAQLWTPTGYAVGVGYCSGCCPPFGAPGPATLGHVLGHETARGRYHAWYQDQHGEWLRAWLNDGNNGRAMFDEVTIHAIMGEWMRDRA